MNTLEAIQSRHAVRSFKNQKIESETIATLNNEIDRCNKESGLHIQLITEEPEAFNSFLAHYGKFSNCNNYFAIVGRKGNEEAAGYYGEQLVLKAQELGLNTCWVVLTYKKNKKRIQIDNGEKIIIVIALGYGTTQGIPHKSKDMAQLCTCKADMPAWFRNGMEAAMLAPTALNQQKFMIELTDDQAVSAKALSGMNTVLDLGIVKYHFEIGAGVNNFKWL